MADFPTNGDDAIFGDDSNNNIDALAGNDLVAGGNGNDTLSGNTGDDLLNPGNGVDQLNGGAGIDTVFYSFDASGVIASLQSGKGWHKSSNEATDGDTYSSIENLTGTAHEDTLQGDSNANLLRGLAGRDTLKGGGGADRLEGAGGNDVIYDGTGNDQIFGGSGIDNIYGDFGADTIDGGADFDYLHYNNSKAGVTVIFSFSGAIGDGGYAEGDSIKNVAGVIGSAHNDTLWGYDGRQEFDGLAGDDDLRGADGDDSLEAGEGKDTVYGGAGNDNVSGGDGADEIEGNSGVDTSVYFGSKDAVIVDLFTGASKGGHAEGDTIISVENLTGTHLDDTLRGDGGANALLGNNGNDVLVGRGSADLLDGGRGQDNMNGGVGPDVYQYTSIEDTGVTASERDIVINFQQNIDLFDLAAIDANLGGPGDGEFSFIGKDAFSGAFGELRYRHEDGKTFVIANVVGNTFGDFVIQINQLVNLTEDDFVL